ncbi:hypothetical protein [Actinomadura macrotermitis]|uniref:Uncharacterized protein n=1 Tax=Actinomadura macrotermitis TaxID=2585200 RepID=A0A7K0C3K4_9ACTN|nr:hypothetical protein [Actinomadura macrotermitis]MQY08003.1 hypothetical protein [Actinomadura macrotermitis]
MTASPRVLVVVHVPEFRDHEEDAKWEGDIMAVSHAIDRAGVNSTVAFGLSDLAAETRSRPYDAAVVDLACPEVDAFVTRLVAETPRPLKLASMRFWTPVPDSLRPSWAIRHIDYGHAEQFGAELRALADA